MTNGQLLIILVVVILLIVFWPQISKAVTPSKEGKPCTRNLNGMQVSGTYNSNGDCIPDVGPSPKDGLGTSSERVELNSQQAKVFRNIMDVKSGRSSMQIKFPVSCTTWAEMVAGGASHEALATQWKLCSAALG